jgi:nitrite reductase/ring-hydroxylating ferredoxin subunit
MYFKSKIAIFLIAVLITVSLTSCKKSKNDVIPDVYVDFTIDLNDPEFFDLNAIGNTKIVTSLTNNWGISAAGYGSNGIIVYRSTTEEFYAYDRTCPHDFAVNSKSIKLNIDGIFAVCPECGTTYALPSFGTPYSGIGRYPLKNYKTSFNGQFIHVWHYL